MARKRFEQTEETAKIIDYLLNAPFNTTIEFDQISGFVGFTVSSQLAAYQSAKRFLLRENGIVIDSIRGVGCSKLQSSDILRRSPQHFRSIRNRAKTGSAEIEIAITGNLDRVEMLQATENFARFRIIADNSRPAVTNRSPQEKPAKEDLPPVTEIAKNMIEK